MLKIGERFSPHPNLKKVYFTYLVLAAIPLLVAAKLPILITYIFFPTTWQSMWAYLLIPLIVAFLVLGFVAYWIQRYCSSISYALTDEEVLVERGVWWKMKHVVPYARVMSIDIIQGPISRHFGVGAVHVYTAGYTGQAGGTAGPSIRGAEATIWGVQNFQEIRDKILEMVRGRPLFGVSKVAVPDWGSKVLDELKRIRKAVEKQTKL